MEKLPFQEWKSIAFFHHVRQNSYAARQGLKLIYRAKIKLHGTNAGVQVTTDGFVAAQKRTAIITPESDNAGFAAWVHSNLEYFSELKTRENITIFGEWCGKGIHKKAAISQIDRQIFAIFAIQFGDDVSTPRKLEICPHKIREFLPDHDDIFVIPFYGDPITIDFGNKEQLIYLTDVLNKIVYDVEKVDPWVRDTFGIEGIGEGLVMYPDPNLLVEKDNYADLIFKAKGLEYQVIKHKKPVSLSPEKPDSIAQFIELFVTKARLEQAVTEGCQGEYSIQKMGDFLRWLVTDIKKESIAELEASELTWKKVQKRVTSEAMKWYRNKIFA